MTTEKKHHCTIITLDTDMGRARLQQTRQHNPQLPDYMQVYTARVHPVSPQLGCRESHLNVWQQAESVPYLTVLEDDVRLLRPWSEWEQLVEVAAAKGVDCLFGGISSRPFLIPENVDLLNGLLECPFISGFFMYCAISPRAKQLWRELKYENSKDIDCEVQGMANLKHAVAWPFFATTSAGYSVRLQKNVRHDQTIESVMAKTAQTIERYVQEGKVKRK